MGDDGSTPTKFGGRFLATLRVAFLSIPALASTAAAYLAAQATFQVYQTEHARLAHDRLRHVSDIIHNYSKASTIRRPCLQTLMDDTLLSWEEFRALLSAPENFHYNKDQHARLILCLRQPTAGPPASYEWTSFDTYTVASFVRDELSHLDAYLFSYKYRIGDRAIICENIRGFLEPADRLLQRFIQRLIDYRMLNDDNFPNINLFMSEYTKDNSTCPEYAPATVDFLKFVKDRIEFRIFAR